MTINIGRSQLLNQDADGKSAVVFQGGNLAFDLGKTEFSVSYYNFDVLKTKPNRLLLGGSLRGRSESGIAEIFNAGKVLPAGEISGLGGWIHRSSKQNELVDRWEERIEKNNLEIDAIDIKIKKNLADIQKIEEQPLKDFIAKCDTKDSQVLCDSLEAYIKKHPGETLNELKKMVMDLRKLDEDRNYKTDLNLFLGKESIKQRIKYRRLIVYVKGDVKVTGFDGYVPSTGSFNSQFGKKTALDWNLFLGVNYNTRQFALGMALGYGQTSNLTDLSSKEYTITTELTDSASNQTMTTTKKVNAYMLGDFFQYQRFTTQFDLVYFAPLGGEEGDKGILAWDFLYGRLFVPTTRTLDVPITLNLGMSGNFINGDGKFCGGLYLQYNDVWDGRGSMGQSTNLIEKFSFGITAKYNFSRMDVSAK